MMQTGPYWIRRERLWQGVWHKVESEIGDRVVTKCGRQMGSFDARGRELEWLFSDPPGACHFCASVVPSVSPSP